MPGDAPTVDINVRPKPVYSPKTDGNYWVSTIVSADASTSGVVSGSSIDVRGLSNITAYVSRGVSTGAIELECSPDGTNWWNWETFATGALPAAGDIASQDVVVSGGCFGYVRGIPNVSGTATSPIVVRLNGLTK